MTVVNPKSISGINSITTGSGSDDILTIHTNNGTERLRVDSTGTTKIVTGIVTTLTATSSAKVGSGVTLSPDGDAFFTGVTTATTFVGALTGNVTGNISGGTVAGSTGTFSGAVSGTTGTFSGAISGTTGTFTSHVSLGDNDQLRIGDGDDLQIYHDASNTVLVNNTGDLYIQNDSSNDTNKILIRPKAGEASIECVPNGEVSLFHDNTKQCETAADGLAFPSGKGINFNLTADASGTGVTAGSETLDDYEEGTWTPTFDAGGGVTFSYNHQYGFYTKIGDTVTFQLYLMGHASSISSGNGGNGVVIQGLPYTLLNHARYYPAFTIGRTYHFDIDSDKRIYAYGDSNSTNVRLIVESDDTAGTVLTAGQLDNNPCLIQVGGVYRG